MTLSYWNAQFQFAEVIPDFTARLAAIKALSADADQQFSWNVLRYGDNSRQCLLTQTVGTHGAVRPVFIHGGFWRAQNAGDFTATSIGLQTLGTPVVHLEYRLMPEHRMSELISDVAEALMTLAEETPDDPRPFLLVGHSVGAHLALEALRHHHQRLGWRVTQSAFVVGLSGVYDLEPLAFSFLQDEIALEAKDIAQFSPINAPVYNPERVMLAVGGEETAEMIRQAQFLSASQNIPLRILSRHDHLSVLDELYSGETGFIHAITEHISE